ncbi:MAG: hypothetical protein ABIK86_06280 [candidate division WOR-3 bacterium]
MSRFLFATGIGLAVLVGAAVMRSVPFGHNGRLTIGADGRVSEVKVQASGPRMVLEPVEVVAPRVVAQAAGRLSAN